MTKIPDDVLKNLQDYKNFQKEIWNGITTNDTASKVINNNTINKTFDYKYKDLYEAYQTITGIKNKITCLICQKSFPPEKIICLPIKQQNNGLTIDYIQEYNCIDCWEALNFSKAARPKTLKEINLEAKMVEIKNYEKFVSMDDIKKIKNTHSQNSYFYDYKTNFIKPLK